MGVGADSGAQLWKIQLADVISKPGVLALVLYMALLLILSLFGAVVFFFGVRERDVSPDGVQTKTAFSAWGILLFLAVSILLML